MDRFLLKTPSFGGKRKQDNVCEPSSSSKKVTPAKGEQMFLDIGQKFGATKHCSKCGMLLVISDSDDNRRHSKFCKEVNSLPSLPTLKGHCVRAQFADASEHILEVLSAQKLHSKQIQGVLDIVSTELGCSSDFLSEDRKVYLYTGKNLSIVGCLVVDDVPLDSTVHLYTAEDVSRLTVASSSSTCLSESTENKDLNSSQTAASTATIDCSARSSNSGDSGSRTLGVRLIWVASQCRRAGIASRLVDTARQHYRYGSVVDRRWTAFSQPTEEGFAFALKYCRGDSVLGY